MMKVIISDSTFSSDKPEREILQRRGCSLVRYQCETEDQLIEAGRGAHAALVQYANITRRVLESWTDCGIIVRYGIGTDNIDLRAAEEFGITVCNVPTYCLDEVADHTAALLLSGLRKVLPLHEAVRRGVWDVERIAKPLPAFTDTVVGLVGFGKIAVRVAERLVPFHLQLRM
ncbi:MAG TPA: NAD(P)-dependent oxidoreductase, partial [Paenibacillus sp.]|nr:NAD(P)-dependent oxidoreductase [Paenibacillus sp.]